MELVIYTYGYGDAMFSVLNGIKMVINTPFFKLMIQLFAAVSLVVAATSYATTRSMNLMSKPIIARIAAIYLVINLLLTPNCRVWVADRVSKTKQSVDNLPFAFVPIGWLEGVGDLISGAVEQAFSPVSDDHSEEVMQGARFNYRDYGLGFGAQLMREARNWRIQNPEFALNMNNFIRRCVMYEALIGYKYTQSQLYSAPNAWQLVKDNAGGFTRVILNIDGHRENLTCHEAAEEFDRRYFTSEIEELKRRNIGNVASSASPDSRVQTLLASGSGLVESKANKIFMDNIQKVHGNFMGGGSAVDIIKQQLMLSSLKTFHASSSYGLVRAKMNQESTWLTGGLLAAEYLPIILTLAKCLMYAGLLFLLPMMVLSGGIARFQSYLLAVASLQLWPCLYSILNMFVEMYSSKSIFGVSNGILSYATYSAIGHASDKIAAIAGSLQVFIPFISYQIVQGSIGGFVHLAGNLTAATQSAASGAASEVTTRNRSLDNVSIGNMQVAMQSGFKTDFNQSYASGSSTFQHLDGAMESVTADNTRAISSSHMKDQGAVSLNVHESVEQGLTQNLERARSSLSNVQLAKKDAAEAHTAASVDFLSKATENRISGKSINFDKSSEETRNMEKMTQIVEAISKEKGISTKEASNLALRGGINSGILKQFGLDIGASTEKTFGKEEHISEGQSDSAQKGEIAKYISGITNKAAENDHTTAQFGIDKGTSEAVTATTQKIQAIEQVESQAKEDIARYSSALSNHQSSGGTLSQDSNHLAIERLKDNYNLTDKEAHDWFHNPSTTKQRNARDQVAKGLMQQEMSRAMGKHNMNSKIEEFKENYANKDLSTEYASGQKAINAKHLENSIAVSETATNQGFDKKEIANEVAKQEAKLQERSQEFKGQADEEIDKSRSKLNKHYQEKQDNTIYKLPKEKKAIIMPAYRDKK
jgi:conjugal transfer mating pair stabilization protein TraG